MDIVQSFYDNIATQYDKLFADWQATTREQALILQRIFAAHGYDQSARLLDCAAASARRPSAWRRWAMM